MIECKLVKTIPTNNTLGECTVWDNISKEIIWTDIQNNKIYFYNINNDQLRFYILPERLCSFALTNESNTLLAAFETGLAVLKFEDRIIKVTWLKKIFSKGCGIRLNDGRVDKSGIFWFGAMVENTSLPKAFKSTSRLYSFDNKKLLRIHESNISISNSISWSLDGSLMYFSDSAKHEIYVYDYDYTNCILSNKRLFVSTLDYVFPDGSCVDSDNYLWNAQWGSGNVIRYSRDGTVNRTLKIPCPQPTCVTFGGDNLDLLIVSTAKEGLSRVEREKIYPESGNIFIYKTNVTGKNEFRFPI